MKWNLKEIVNSMTGSIHPHGDSDFDELILMNVELKAELMISLINEFIEVMAQRNRSEQSVNRVVSEVASTLADIKEKIQDLAEEMKVEENNAAVRKYSSYECHFCGSHIDSEYLYCPNCGAEQLGNHEMEENK